MSPLRGEKPIFGPLSKNNTGMAALRAGLPVIKQNVTNASNQLARWQVGTGSGPLPLAKFHIYRGKNVGIQPRKLSDIAHKFVLQGRLVCNIFTKFSAFVRVYR